MHALVKLQAHLLHTILARTELHEDALFLAAVHQLHCML